METSRGKLRAIIHARMSRGFAGQHFEDHFLPQAAAKFSRAAGVGEQFALVHADRRDRLDHLGWHASDAAGERGGRQPVAIRTRAHAARGKINVGEHVMRIF